MKTLLLVSIMLLPLSIFSQDKNLLFIPISIDQAAVSNAIKNATPKNIRMSESSKTEKMKASIKIVDGPTTFNNITITHNVRLKEGKGYYKRRGYGNLPFGGRFYTPWISANVSELRGNGSAAISITLGSDYKLYSNAIVKFKADNMKLYGLNVTSALKFFNKHHIKMNVSKDINKELSKLKLREKILKIWKDIQRPIKIDSNFYLLIDPDYFIFKNIAFESNKMNFGLGLVFGAHTGNEGDAKKWQLDKALKQLAIIKDTPKENISLDIPINIDFKTIELSARRKFNKTYLTYKNEKGKEKRYAKIIGTEVLPSQDSLYDIRLGLNIRVLKCFRWKKAQIYLNCKLKYDEAKRIFSIAEYKLDLNSRSWLIDNSLKALTNNIVYDFIKKKLTIDVKQKLDNVTELFNNKLTEKIEISPGVFLTGKMTEVDLTKIETSNAKLLLNVELRGAIGIEAIDLNI